MSKSVISAKGAMKLQRKLAPNSLNYIGGEFRGHEQNWIEHETRRIARALGIPGTTLFWGDHYRDYLSRRTMGQLYSHRIGQRLAAGALQPLRYPDWARQDGRTFNDLNLGATAWHTRSIGEPDAYRFFSGVPTKYRQAFIDLMVASNKTILSERPDTVLQVELSLQFVRGIKLGMGSYDRMFRYYVHALQATVDMLDATARQHPGVRVVFHPRPGNLNGPLTRRSSRTMTAGIAMTNAITHVSQGKSWRVVGIGVLFGDGLREPEFTPNMPELWRQLKPVPSGCALLLGVAHSNALPDYTVAFVRELAPVIIEHGQVETFGITLARSTAGFGREAVERGIGNCAKAADQLNAA